MMKHAPLLMLMLVIFVVIFGVVFIRTARAPTAHPPQTASVPHPAIAKSRCAMCGKAFGTENKTQFHLQQQNGKDIGCYCAHCGLYFRCHLPGKMTLSTYDYQSGKSLSAARAVYVAGSKVNYCCGPSYLAFANKADAERFRQQQGGKMLTYQQALDEVAGKRAQ